MTEGRHLPSIDEECDLLIVRGASSTDDLVPLGLPFAERYSRAKTVVLVPNDGPPRSLKGDAGQVCFVDADSRMSKVAEVLQRIKASYEEAHPKAVHQAHEIVGMFLFWWLSQSAEMTGCELIAAGLIDALEKSAEAWIETDFGCDLQRLATLLSDGDDSRRAAAGRPVGPAASS